MLELTRKIGQSIYIRVAGEVVKVHVMNPHRNDAPDHVRIGIEGDRDRVWVRRMETVAIDLLRQNDDE